MDRRCRHASGGRSAPDDGSLSGGLAGLRAGRAAAVAGFPSKEEQKAKLHELVADAERLFSDHRGWLQERMKATDQSADRTTKWRVMNTEKTKQTHAIIHESVSFRAPRRSSWQPRSRTRKEGMADELRCNDRHRHH